MLQIGSYDLVKELGRGAMGVVYEAHHKTTNARYALKVLLKANEIQRKRFEREAQTLQRLKHPNIVGIYEGALSQQKPYLVMDYVYGYPLNVLLSCPWPPRAALALIVKLAQALSYAHSQGVVHRDLKPANIVVDKEKWQPVIMDFGLAKVMDAEQLTRTGAIMGTPRYMSPEQAEGQTKVIDHRSDIYALGTILYELLTGRGYIDKNTKGLTAVLHHVLYSTPPNPSSLIANIPPQIDLICQKATHKKAPERFSDACELAKTIYQIAGPLEDISQLLPSLFSQKNSGSNIHAQETRSKPSTYDPHIPPSFVAEQTHISNEVDSRQSTHNRNAVTHTSHEVSAPSTYIDPNIASGQTHTSNQTHRSAYIDPNIPSGFVAGQTNISGENPSLPAMQNSSVNSQTLGRYQIIKELGSGGMGRVYLAYDPRLRRNIALKVLLAGELAGAKEKERFLREAQATAKLQHPNIVSVYDIGEVDGKIFFTMDLIDGCSLDKFAKQKLPFARQTAEIMVKIAQAIHYAHSQGIIHRDLKPANIMMDNYEEPKVMDFGLAKVHKTSKNLSNSGAIMGTLQYMSPEQAEGKTRQTDQRSDVYALGAILYEMLTGRPPFDGNSQLMLLKQILKDDPRPPRSLKASVNKDMESICLKALEKDKQRRYQSAADFAEDLLRFSQGEPVKAHPIGPIRRLARKIKRHAIVVALSSVFFIVILILLLSKEKMPPKKLLFNIVSTTVVDKQGKKLKQITSSNIANMVILWEIKKVPKKTYAEVSLYGQNVKRFHYKSLHPITKGQQETTCPIKFTSAESMYKIIVEVKLGQKVRQKEIPLQVKQSLNNPVRLDLSFNQQGFFIDHLLKKTGAISSVYATTIAEDNFKNIVIAGCYVNAQNNYDGAVWRLSPDGRPDPGFAGTGCKILNNVIANKGGEQVWSIAIDKKNRIVVAGEVILWGATDMVLWRLLPNGSLDPSFGNKCYTVGRTFPQKKRYLKAKPGRVILINIAQGNMDSNDSAKAIVLDHKNRIVIVGKSFFQKTGRDEMVMLRLRENGSLDPSFANKGFVVHRDAAGGKNDDVAFGVTIDRKNRIVAVGESARNSPTVEDDRIDDMVIWRYREDGTADTSFANKGFVVYKNPMRSQNFRHRAESVVIDKQNRIVITGMGWILPRMGKDQREMYIWRYLEDGSLDESFGSEGVVTFNRDSILSRARMIALDKKGRILVGGWLTRKGKHEDIALWCYLENGQPDYSFAPEGLFTWQNQIGLDVRDLAYTMTLDSKDRILLAGFSYNKQRKRQMAVLRLQQSK